MKKAVFSLHFDTNLMPVERNLCLRNGIYYFRRMVGGRRIFLSLRTSNPYVAHYLLNVVFRGKNAPQHTVLSEKIQSKINVKVLDIKLMQMNKKQVIMRPSKKQYKYKGFEMTEDGLNNVMLKDIWNNYVEHEFNERDKRTADNRVDVMLSFLPDNITIGELAANPKLTTNVVNGLLGYVQPQGKNKGQKYSRKTIRECLRLFRQIINVAESAGMITNASVLLSGLKYKLKKADKSHTSVERLPLDDADYEKLFGFMAKLKKHDFTELDALIAQYTDKKSELNRIRNFPEHFYYAILIALFTGSRANAVITLRHSDIETIHETPVMHFHKNENLVNANDEREKQKHLKTEESARQVPIANTLIQLGFDKWLATQEAKDGPASFIFERVIETRQGYKPGYMNESVNALLFALGIKPPKNSKCCKDFHSFRTSIYSVNIVRIDRNVLNAIVGHKSNTGNIGADAYTKVSMYSNSIGMVTAVNTITYPHIELLFDGEQQNGSTPSTTNILNTAHPVTTLPKMCMVNSSPADRMLLDTVSRMTGQKIKAMAVFTYCTQPPY